MPKSVACPVYAQLAANLEDCLNTHARLMLAEPENTSEDHTLEAAHANCIDAREKLKAHVLEHGCQRDELATPGEPV